MGPTRTHLLVLALAAAPGWPASARWRPIPRRGASAPAQRPAEAPAADPGACPIADLPRARVWRLTQTQLRNSLQDLFGFSGAAVDSLPAESRLEGFDNTADRLGVPSLLLDRYNTLAEEIASEAVRRHQALLPCPLAELGDEDAAA